MKKITTKSPRYTSQQLAAFKAHRTMVLAQLKGDMTKAVRASLEAKVAHYDMLIAA